MSELGSVGRARRVAHLGGGGPGGLQPDVLPDAEAPAAADPLAVALERCRGAHPDGVSAPHDLRAALAGEEEARREEPVLEARRDRRRNVHGAAAATQAAENRVVGADLRRLGGIERRDRHAVGQLEDAAGTAEGRDEHVRVVEVCPASFPDIGRHDLERPATLRIEKTAEDGRGVEAGEAGPVDCAVAPDERRRVAIADERVVGDPVHGEECLGSRRLDRQ